MVEIAWLPVSMNWRTRFLALAGLLGLWVMSMGAFAQTPPLAAMLNEQIIMLPVGGGFGATQLETTIFKPNGDGPFPLALINHGKSPGNPLFQERARFLMAANALVARGYPQALKAMDDMARMATKRGFTQTLWQCGRGWRRRSQTRCLPTTRATTNRLGTARQRDFALTGPFRYAYRARPARTSRPLGTVVAHFLGKEEVVSPILTGGSRAVRPPAKQ